MKMAAVGGITPQVTQLGCIVATLALLPFAPLLLREVKDAGTTKLGWIVYLHIFPSAIGFAAWTIALRRTSARRRCVMLYLVPLIAVVLGWALLGETPQWLAIAGGAFCLGGVYLARHD